MCGEICAQRDQFTFHRRVAGCVVKCEELGRQLFRCLSQPDISERFSTHYLTQSCISIELICTGPHRRRKLLRCLGVQTQQRGPTQATFVSNFFDTLAAVHGIKPESTNTIDDIRISIARHIGRGFCARDDGGGDCAIGEGLFCEH
jgi:hypothetical protein